MRAAIDPWTALSLPVDSDIKTIKKQYKKLIAKYHPDVDPSRGAANRLREIVQAYGVIRDQLQDRYRDLEQQKQRVDREEELRKVNEYVAKAKANAEAQLNAQAPWVKREQDSQNQQLGALGGAALGFVVAGPVGGVVGGFAGIVLRDDNSLLGQTLRSVGDVSKSLADAVSNVVAPTTTQKQKVVGGDNFADWQHSRQYNSETRRAKQSRLDQEMDVLERELADMKT